MAFISKEELEELYWGEPGTEMGAIIIADKLNCKASKVYYYLRKYNIPRRPSVRESDECITKASIETAGRKIKKLYEIGVLDKSGKNHHNYGKKLSAEAKKKLSETRKGSLSASTIDEDIALEIYNLYKNTDISLRSLREQYKYSKKTIYDIVKCEHWATKDLKPLALPGRNKGDSHHNSKIDKKIGKEIYDKYKTSDITIKDLAKEYRVNIATIGFIVRCTHWTTKCLTPISKPKGTRGISHYRSKINKETGLEIYNKYKAGDIKEKVLANDYEVSVRTIGRIVTCKHWTTRYLLDE